LEFEEYYKSLGLVSYPFSLYTAEAERDKAESIYKKPSNYSVIDEAIRSSSVIITGERGSGKTALNLDVVRRKNSEHILLVRLEEFSGLEEGYGPEQLYDFIVQHIASEFFKKISSHPGSLWKYNKDDRLHLSMYLHQYVPASTKHQLREQIRKIQQGFVKRSAVGLYNSTRLVLNYGLKAITKTVSDALTKHFSALPEFDSGDIEYFRKLEMEVDEGFTPADRSFYLLEKLCSLVLNSKIKEIILVIDKIDEDPRLQNDAERIASFIEGFASNHKVLINNDFKVLLFVWSTPFNSVRSNIRTQKIVLQPLSWTRDGLREAAGKRLSAFSNQQLVSLDQIFDEDGFDSFERLIEMSNENPRDLWHLLDKALVAQFEIDSSKKITKEAIDIGIERFVRQFNYYEYYPRKSNARADSMDVYSFIKHLMKLDSNDFTKNKLSEMAKTGGSTNNYVISMENMGLIKKTGNKTTQGGVIYEIKDPKVRYAREYGVDISAA